jgi:DNA-binding XRE family transcriptional regulator
VKKYRTKNLFEVKGEIPQWLLNRLKDEYGKNLKISKYEDDEACVNIVDTDWYKAINKKMKPGDYVKIYRENYGFTQAELGEKLGSFSRQNVSAIENGHRGISKSTAKKLSKIFNVPIERFF